MNVGYVARWMVAGGVAVAVACGGSTSGTSSSSLESEDGGADAGDDGSVTTALPDSGGSVDSPMPSCGCENRQPECVDDDTLKWFAPTCDAGACEYIPETTPCPPNVDGPACKDGRCTTPILR